MVDTLYTELMSFTISNSELVSHIKSAVAVKRCYSIVGLDIGRKKIGIAVYCSSVNLVLPVKTMVCTDRCDERVKQICTVLTKREADAVVIGVPMYFPYSKDKGGSVVSMITDCTRNNGSVNKYQYTHHHGLLSVIRDVVIGITNTIPHKPITLYDERFTTAMANRLLKEVKMSRKNRNRMDDEIAAAIMLEGFVKKFCGVISSDVV